MPPRKFFLLLFLLLPLFCTASDAGCTPSFPYKQGWWGADAAYSIPLPDGRVVWIFGDTLFGDKRVVDGNDPRMVRNTIGISTCNNGQWNIDYVMRRSATGKPLDFFQARTRNYWYWALDGVYHDGRLYVTLLCIRNKPVTQADPLGFETCGSDLARVGDLSTDPQDWTVEYFPLVSDGVKAYPSSAAAVDGDHAYFFALYESSRRPMLLTRVPLAGLGDPQKNLEYYAKDGSWKGGFLPGDAAQVMSTGNSEMSVKFHKDINRWVAVMMDTSLTGKIIYRTAPKITGPWSQDTVLYNVPERDAKLPGYDPDTFCYAGKEHPEFDQSGTILFTYACNTMKVPKLVTNLGIYIPKAVRVPQPKD